MNELRDLVANAIRNGGTDEFGFPSPEADADAVLAVLAPILNEAQAALGEWGHTPEWPEGLFDALMDWQ